MNGTCINQSLQRLTLPGKYLTGFTLLLVSTAANAAVEQEIQFVFNTFSFLVWGALIMWMCAGFTMLESGSVRTKNASVICLKNIGIYSIAGLMYYFIGYNLMYTDVSGWIGSFTLLYGPSADELALLSAIEEAKAVVVENGLSADELALLSSVEEAKAAVIENGYSVMSDWFFQMVFVATTASIISGAMAERVRLWSFFIFTIFLTGLIYPIVGAWTWGGGWLNEMGFQDFAGSTIVHSTGGWAALAGALVVGPRLGKFRPDGSVKSTPPSNVPIVTLGVFILWLGWFGFNGGSQLALGGAADAVAMSNVLVNTNPGGGGRGYGGYQRITASPGTGRPARRTERRNSRAGLNYRGAGYRRSLLGSRYRDGRRRYLRGRNEAPGNMESG